MGGAEPPLLMYAFVAYMWATLSSFRLQLKCDGTRWRTGGEVTGKLANEVGSQYSLHYLETLCI